MDGQQFPIHLCVRTTTPSWQHVTYSSSESAIVTGHIRLPYKIMKTILRLSLGCFEFCLPLFKSWRNHTPRCPAKSSRNNSHHVSSNMLKVAAQLSSTIRISEQNWDRWVWQNGITTSEHMLLIYNQWHSNAASVLLCDINL